MSLFTELETQILANNKEIKIVFPEGWNTDIQKAAATVLEKLNGIIKPILIFRNKNELPSNLPDKITTFVIEDSDLSKYIEYIFEARKMKNITMEQATQLASQPNFLASAMVAMNEADGEICGIEYTTADTLRAALQIVKAHHDVKTVCSAFIMEKDDERLVFGDSSVNINPNYEELASIAKSIAQFSTSITRLKDVRVAMLSYSTDGSGKGESVDKVKQAYNLICLDESFINRYNVFGEIQFDAAYDINVMHKKAKKLNWNKPANVFIFPNIDAGNIGYKIAQRLGKYQAIGPTILGLNKPVNDLSRGASAEDVVKLAYLTAAQVIKNK